MPAELPREVVEYRAHNSSSSLNVLLGKIVKPTYFLDGEVTPVVNPNKLIMLYVASMPYDTPEERMESAHGNMYATFLCTRVYFEMALNGDIRLPSEDYQYMRDHLMRAVAHDTLIGDFYEAVGERIGNE